MGKSPISHFEANRSPPEKACKSGLLEIGTACAIIVTHKSCTASVLPGARNGWGGARNSAARTSIAIKIDAAKSVMLAARQSVRIGLPLNRHVTIHWGLAGIPDTDGMRATAKFLSLARDWLRKRGFDFAWVFTRENGDGKGEHVHILMHVPPHLGVEFGQRQRRWIRNITGNKYKTGTILTRRVGGNLHAAWRSPEIYVINLGAVVAYLLKGVTQDVGEILGIPGVESGGHVIGKRTGYSENLGATAIAKTPGGLFLASEGEEVLSTAPSDNKNQLSTTPSDNKLSHRWAWVAGRIRRFPAFEHLFRLP